MITSSVVVELPVQQTWDLYVNNSLLSVWAPAVTKIESDSPALEVGVTRKCSVLVDAKFGHTVEQCTLFDPLKRIEVSVIEETFGFSHMLVSYGFTAAFHSDGGNTLLIMETHYQPKKIFASVMTSAATQQQLLDLMITTLQGFKQYAER